MKHTTITSAEFLKGTPFGCGHQPPKRHGYRARLVNGSVIVIDEAGDEVVAHFGGSADNRTLYCTVDGVGVIGGWTYPHKAQPFAKLVDYINHGKLYRFTSELPKSSRVKCCPHCGKEF